MLEIESHVAAAGWDQPARLYALVETARLVRTSRRWPRAMGLDDASAAGLADPGRAGPARREQPLEATLESIVWPAEVAGCAAVVERLVLPPGADAELPDDPTRGTGVRHASTRTGTRSGSPPGVTRAGATYCALRLREHDDDHSVVDGTDLVPGLLDLLRATLQATTLTTPDVHGSATTTCDPAQGLRRLR